MKLLPIDPALPRIVDTLRSASGLVLEAPPGAGKTTRVPRALLDAGFAEKGEILVLEPRRLAARLSARRVAEELGEAPGKTVGYTMRFEDASSRSTRVRFVTEGVLTRRLLSDPELAGVSVVVLDEFHERSLTADVGLALLRRLQKAGRPDLKLCAMSATLESQKLAEFLGGPVITCEGRAFEVAIEYLPKTDDRPLERMVKGALADALRAGLDGDVLVFLPGMLEIRRAAEACAPLAKEADLLVLPLHGSLSPAEQDRAVAPNDRRKVVLATNVAETSITIDGVTVVIDSGLANVASSSPWSGLPVLKTSKISRASAVQRAGRAGRTREGRCVRLYTRGDFETRPAHDAPEIARADLAEAALELVAAGARDLEAFPWFEAPPPSALDAAETLLGKLGALDADRKLTPTGRRLLRFPTHPRLARIVVESERRGIAAEGCTVAALLGERDLGSASRRATATHRSDVLELLDRFAEAEAARFAPDRLVRMGIDPNRANAVRRVRDRLRSLADASAEAPRSREENDRAVLVAVLAGYPDRVGRLRSASQGGGRSASAASAQEGRLAGSARELAFAGGGTAKLADSSGVSGVDLAVAVDVEERTTGKGAQTLVRLASGIEDDFLIDLFADTLRDETIARWNPERERVDVVRRLAYEGLVLEEKRAPRGDPLAIAEVLAEAVRAKGWRAFTKDDALDGWIERVAFARKACPELGLPVIDQASIEAELSELCEGCSSFAELAARDLGSAVRNRLSHEAARALAEAAPEVVTLPSGRRLHVDYSSGTPSVASRLQDFFGAKRGPAVAKGRVPLVLHLLAPNQRAVQVTTDLEGFWSKHYPAIAKELRRRYPRHPFPDDPTTAAPPKPRA